MHVWDVFPCKHGFRRKATMLFMFEFRISTPAESNAQRWAPLPFVALAKKGAPLLKVRGVGGEIGFARKILVRKVKRKRCAHCGKPVVEIVLIDFAMRDDPLNTRRTRQDRYYSVRHRCENASSAFRKFLRESNVDYFVPEATLAS